MGPFWRHLAVFGRRGAVIPVCWDVWEPDLPGWRDKLRRYDLAAVVCSSRAATEALQAALPDTQVHCVLEAVNAHEFNGGRALADRRLHVLEAGRRYDAWHGAVRDPLAAGGFRHVYEGTKGRLAIPSHDRFLEALSDAAIGVCFPSSMTHPARSGGFEAVTRRYFEYMASGALLFGHAPQDLVDWCGYNPVIEVDLADAAEQVLGVLSDLPSYQPLVDRNRQLVNARGTWNDRAALITDIFARSAA
jgi:hypothetical protein